MTTRSLDRADRFASDRLWTLVAAAYDPSVAIVGWHRWQDALLADVTRGLVLDVGCGPAHLAKAVLARGASYVGLDRNEAMVTRAMRTVRPWGPGRGRVVRADLTAVPFEDASFDVVVATGVLGLLAVPVRRVALSEMVRVSRGEIRLLEPVARPGEPVRVARSRVVALVRDRPLELGELVEVGLEPKVVGPPRLAGVYSMMRAGKR